MKTYKNINEEGNATVKLCQSCAFFNQTTFSHTLENYCNDEIGVFDLWIWNGYCLNPLNPPRKALHFYRETTSKHKCEFYLFKDNYQDFLVFLGDQKDKKISKKEYLHVLARFNHEKEDTETKEATLE